MTLHLSHVRRRTTSMQITQRLPASLRSRNEAHRCFSAPSSCLPKRAPNKSPGRSPPRSTAYFDMAETISAHALLLWATRRFCNSQGPFYPPYMEDTKPSYLLHTRCPASQEYQERVLLTSLRIQRGYAMAVNDTSLLAVSVSASFQSEGAGE